MQLGGSGLTDGVVRATDDALAAHELIKVRVEGDRDARKTLAEDLAARTQSELAQVIGRVVVLYRPAKQADKRRITLPR